MHKQSYSQYFYRALLDFNKVNIPGLGHFYLEHHTAELSADKQSMKPPSSRIKFDSFEDSTYNISKLLQEAGLNPKLSIGIEKYYESQANISKQSGSPFVLEGLGKLISTSFLPDDASVFNIYEGLENIRMNAVGSGLKNIVHDEEYLYNLSKSQSSKSNSTFTEQYLWPFIIGLVTLFVILFWIFSPKPEVNPSIPQPSEIKTPTEIVDTTTVADHLKVKESPKVDTVITIAEVTKERVKESPEINTDKGNISSSNLVKDDENCIIIVGAFKNTANAQRMIQRISSKGYQTFTSNHQGLKRVGVKYNCQIINTDSFKAKIRSQFNNEAWSLSDTL